MKRLGWIALTIAVLVIAAVIYLCSPVEVKTGKIIKCLDAHHAGSPIIRSTVRILRVPRKDAAKYHVVEEATVCETCQARLQAEQRASRSEGEAGEKFARAVWIHDAAVYACMKQFVSVASAGSVSKGRRHLRELKRLAHEGRELRAPASLRSVQSDYTRSMDEHLESISCVEDYLTDNHEQSLTAFAIHTAAARTCRDKAIQALDRCGYPVPPGVITYSD